MYRIKKGLKNMLKQKEWLDVIVAKTGCSRKEAKLYYDVVFDNIREQLNPEEQVKIAGLGVFKLRKTADKEQINLITGQPEIVPAHYVVTFRPYFEIDPKPEAIEVEEDEEEAVAAAEAVTAARAAEVAAEEEARKAAEEEAARKAAEEEAARKAAEEEAARKAAEEEAAKAEEEAAEEAAPEEPVAEEEPEEDDGVVWEADGKEYKTPEVRALLKEHSTLEDAVIDRTIRVVLDRLEELGKNKVLFSENTEKFEFKIKK